MPKQIILCMRYDIAWMTKWKKCIFGLFLMLVHLPSGWGITLNVTPVQIALSATQPIATLVIKNASDEDTTIQAEVVNWQQNGGKDHYQPTNDILFTPILFMLPANHSQLIRFAWLKQEVVNELAYRVILREVIPQFSEAKKNHSQLRFALSLSIPIMIKPIISKELYAWKMKPAGKHHIQLQLHNIGNTVLSITRLQFKNKKKNYLINNKMAYYVLPGQLHNWVVNLKNYPRFMDIIANINGKIQTDRIRFVK